MSLWDTFKGVVDGVDHAGQAVFNTVGNALGGAAENIPGATIGLQALAATTNEIAAGGTYGIAALPGGINTMSWDQAHTVSPGQAAMANSLGPQSIAGGLYNKALDWTVQHSANPAAAAAKRAELQPQMLPQTLPGFDITKQSDRDLANASPMGKMQSGLGDVIFDWYADGGVVLGKAAKIARTGAQVGGHSFMGLTTRTIRTSEDVAALSAQIDSHVMYRKSGGIAGKETALGKSLERTLDKDPAAMIFDPWASKSSNKGLVASLLGESTDLENSALIVKAGIGNADAMNVLRQRAASTADALDRAHKLDDIQASSFKKPIGELGDDLWVKRPQDVERLDQIVADLSARDVYLQRALFLEDKPVINRVGSVSKTLEGARATWYAERGESRLDPKRAVSNTALENMAPQWVDRVYQRNPYVRPVRVITKGINWAQGSRPAGYIGIKGQLFNDSADELFAALTNSPTLSRMQNALYKRDVMNAYLGASNVTTRMNVVTQLERQAANRIASQYGISAKVADSLYASYNRSRESATSFLKDRGYGIDTDGTIIKSPTLSSQLADSLPMMDFRVYEDLIRRHQNPLKAAVGATGDVVHSVLEPIYTAWKFSVLFRLGYVVRNLAEGNARAAAGYGFIPAFTDPWGSVKRAMSNDARREKIARNYVYEVAAGKSPKHISKQIDLLRDAQQAAENQLHGLRAQSEYVRFGEMPAASGVDTMQRDAYYAASADHGVKFDLPDLELSIGSASDSLLPTRQRRQFLSLHSREQSGEILTGVDVQAYRHLRAKAARTRLRELQASGKEIVTIRDGKHVVVKNVRELTDEDLVPLANTRKGAPARAVESGDIPVSSLRNVAKTRQLPDVYVVDNWLHNVKTANAMGETVPGRVAKQARVRNPAPLGAREYYMNETDKQIALSAIDDIRSIEEQLSSLYSKLQDAADRRTGFGKRQRLGDKDVFSDTIGDIARMNSSADGTYEKFLQGQMSRMELQQQRLTNSWGVINPGEKHYFDEFANVVNHQFKNDPLAKMALDGTRVRDAVKWLRSNDGKWYRREMDISMLDIQAHVDTVYGMVNDYLPDPALRARAAEESLSPVDLEAALRGSDLPQIHGRQLAETMVTNHTAAKAARAGLTKVYRLIGSAPEDLAARHPFYRQMHMAEQGRITRMLADQGREITPEVADRIKNAAHSFALKETKRTLYTIERYSNPAMFLRWVMPFFPAYENTIKTWLRLGYEDPSVIARASMIWNAPNKAGLVVDKDGNELPAGSPFSKEAFVVLPEPIAKALSKYTPGGQVPDFPKGSMNFVLPGDSPYLPGVSFLISTPISMWIAADPVREDTVKSVLSEFLGEHGADQAYRFVVPFGTASDDPTANALSASLKQVQILTGGEGNKEFMMSALGIYRDMLNQANAEGTAKPTAEQAIEKAREYRKLRLVTAMTQPFAMRWRSPYQQYINEYHRLTTQYGFEEGERQFDAKYPEYFVLKQSLSSNPTGMSADMGAYKAYKSNTGLWNQVTKIDPKFGQLVTNPVSRGEFNPTVYGWMSGTPIRPGVTMTIHGQQDIEAFDKAAAISKGWDEYRGKKALVDNWLADNGFKSLQDKGAESGKAAWDAWLSSQESGNPEWYTARELTKNSANIRNTLQAVTTITREKSFVGSSPDKDLWVLAEDYLAKRELIVQALEQNDAAGGSKSMTAPSNQQIAELWGAYVAKLRGSNTKFADFYDRWLDSDNLERVTVQ